MVESTLSIGDLARRGGCSAQGVRYYERLGLLPPPLRTAGNQRRYRATDLRRLIFIRHGRELGFSIDALRELLALGDDPEQACKQADALAGAHLRNIRSRIARLQALERELEHMLQHGSHGRVRDCQVIESLADHERCLGDHHSLDAGSETSSVTTVSS